MAATDTPADWTVLAADLAAELRTMHGSTLHWNGVLPYRLSVRELAERTGWSKSTVSQVLRGERPGILNQEAVLAVARHLTFLQEPPPEVSAAVQQTLFFARDLPPIDQVPLYRVRQVLSERRQPEQVVRLARRQQAEAMAEAWGRTRGAWVQKIAQVRQAWEAETSREPGRRRAAATRGDTAPGAPAPAATVTAVTSHAAVPVPRAPIDGELAVTASPELARVIAGWLAEYGSLETLRAYRRELGAFLAWCVRPEGRPAVDPLQARRDDIAAYAAQVLERPRVLVSARGKTRVIEPSAATRARALAVLSSFYGYAHDLEAVPRNPVTVRRPTMSGQGKTPGLTLDEVRALLTAARTWRHGPPGRAAALVHLMAATALRVGEVLGADIDHLGHHQGHAVLWVRRKGADDAVPVPVPPAVTETLCTYLARRPNITTATAPGSWPTAAPGTPLLATATGQRWTEPSVHRLIRRMAATAGLPGAATVRPHSLRVAAATAAYRGGADLVELQAFLDHAQITTTRRYLRDVDHLDRQALQWAAIAAGGVIGNRADDILTHLLH